MVLTFERTTNYELVRAIVTNPVLYKHITDDGSPAREKFRPIEHSAIWYVLVWNDDKLLGLFMFVPLNSVCFEVHTCLLPASWGKHTEAAAQGVAEWIWEHTACQRIITNVPSYNRLALRLALLSGMKEFGVNKDSFLKNGQLYDQIMLGISKPKV